MSKKIIIIGGGAGGGSFAARIRRHDNDAEIKIYERSPFVSYSNCGQPYLISGEKPTFESIIVYSKQDWKEQYNVDAFTDREVIKIDRDKKVVTVKNTKTGEEMEDTYDILMISPGSPAIVPNIPGVKEAKEAKKLHVLKTPDQLQGIMKTLKDGANKVLVVGGGYIGLEIAENCKKAGLDVTLVDAAKQLLEKSVDEDFSVFINQALIENGVDLRLATSLKSVENNGTKTTLSNGDVLDVDIIFLVVGVKPELEMYRKAGIEISEATGGIRANKSSQTNDKSIYVSGDVAETIDWLGNPSRIQLSIVAQRMSTIAANHVYGVDDEFRGVENSASVSIFGRSLGAVGYSEAELKKRNMQYEKVVAIEQSAIINGDNIYLKVLYDNDGLILGAQAAGPLYAEKRVNYAAIAMMYKIPIQDLLHFQVAYNPVIDTQRDPINLAARIARAQQAGITKNITVVEIDEYMKKGYKLLDVRTPGEFARGYINGAELFPLQVLSEKMNTLAKNEKYLIYCRRGARAYNFQLRMQNDGFNEVVNILGAWDHYAVYDKYRFKNNV